MVAQLLFFILFLIVLAALIFSLCLIFEPMLLRYGRQTAKPLKSLFVIPKTFFDVSNESFNENSADLRQRSFKYLRAHCKTLAAFCAPCAKMPATYADFEAAVSFCPRFTQKMSHQNSYKTELCNPECPQFIDVSPIDTSPSDTSPLVAAENEA